MTTRIEDELRELLGSSAEGFEFDESLPPRVLRRARARVFRAFSAVIVVAVLGGALSVVTLRGHPVGSEGTTGRSTGVRLLGYDGDPSYAPDATALKEHAQCMRNQGFEDYPDHAVGSGDNWEVKLPASIDPSSLAFREAEFVTCAMSKFQPMPRGGILGFAAPTQANMQAFLDCMQGRGFDLPQPTQRADGSWQIDLSTSSIDTSSDAWNQALFITCAPPTPPWPPGPSGGPSGPSGASGPSGG